MSDNNTLMDIRMIGGDSVQQYMFAEELFGLLNLRKRGALMHVNLQDYTVNDVWCAMLYCDGIRESIYDRMKARGVYLINRETWIYEDYSSEDDPC